MLQRRSLRHWGGRLAFFTVFLQLVLSLGHIHPADIFPFGHPVVQGHGITPYVAAQPDPSPARQSKGGTAEQACAICANMALAASLVLPDAVDIAVPSSTVHAQTAAYPSLLIAAPPHLLFQTRAPPSA